MPELASGCMRVVSLTSMQRCRLVVRCCQHSVPARPADISASSDVVLLCTMAQPGAKQGRAHRWSISASAARTRLMAPSSALSAPLSVPPSARSWGGVAGADAGAARTRDIRRSSATAILGCVSAPSGAARTSVDSYIPRTRGERSERRRHRLCTPSSGSRMQFGMQVS